MHADDHDPVWESEANAEALAILGYVLTWQMQPERWAEAEQIIGALAEAVANGDVPAMTLQTANLELLGPLRVIRMGELGEAEMLPPPDPVRERVNHLIHVLGEPVRPGSAQQATDQRATDQQATDQQDHARGDRHADNLPGG